MAAAGLGGTPGAFARFGITTHSHGSSDRRGKGDVTRRYEKGHRVVIAAGCVVCGPENGVFAAIPSVLGKIIFLQSGGECRQPEVVLHITHRFCLRKKSLQCERWMPCIAMHGKAKKKRCSQTNLPFAVKEISPDLPFAGNGMQRTCSLKTETCGR